MIVCKTVRETESGFGLGVRVFTRFVRKLVPTIGSRATRHFRIAVGPWQTLPSFSTRTETEDIIGNGRSIGSSSRSCSGGSWFGIAGSVSHGLGLRLEAVADQIWTLGEIVGLLE